MHGDLKVAKDGMCEMEVWWGFGSCVTWCLSTDTSTHEVRRRYDRKSVQMEIFYPGGFEALSAG